jgi:cyclopropane fatty-acyl-phospholipid synthase-like methyltransferase
MAVELAPERFDAVVSFYVLNNLPREQLGGLFARVHGWLKPGGWLLASLPATDNPGWRGAWLGAEMFFSGWDTTTTLGLVRESGLEIVEHAIETMLEPSSEPDWAAEADSTWSEVPWLWLLARRPDQPSSSGRRP